MRELPERTTARISSLKTVSTKQRRIANLAASNPQMAMDVSHHIDQEWLAEAYRRTRKDGAVGIDRVTGEEYGRALAPHLVDLLGRAKTGLYRAPPVKRVYIPKGDGTQTRPLGIPTFEDKVLQRAVSMALEPVFEQDFYPFSYGFRPGKSAHQALDQLWRGLMSMGGGYIIDLDIKGYFDAVDNKHLREAVHKRVRDGVMRRLVGKWLKAGVVENGQRVCSESGVPQGGVISPLLSNIYLHEVLDGWFSEVVSPRMHGRCFMIRYADDAVLVFELEEDARRVYQVLPKRFGKYGLELHPDKTRMIDFRRGSRRDTFDFLGFTHFWAKSRKGTLVVKKQTSKKRFSRSVKATGQWLKKVSHWPIAVQHRALCRKIQGHIGYFGVTGNGKALSAFVYWVQALWRKWLGRRSAKAKRSWSWFSGILRRFPLPKPSPVHSSLRRVARLST